MLTHQVSAAINRGSTRWKYIGLNHRATAAWLDMTTDVNMWTNNSVWTQTQTSNSEAAYICCDGNHQSFNDVNEHFICSLFLCNQNAHLQDAVLCQKALSTFVCTLRKISTDIYYRIICCLLFVTISFHKLVSLWSPLVINVNINIIVMIIIIISSSSSSSNNNSCHIRWLKWDNSSKDKDTDVADVTHICTQCDHQGNRTVIQRSQVQLLAIPFSTTLGK